MLDTCEKEKGLFNLYIKVGGKEKEEKNRRIED